MKKQRFLTAVLSYGLIFVCGTLSAQTWENEMLLGKVKSYIEKLTHYQNGDNTPFLVEGCEYRRYKEFNEQGKIIKYSGKSSNASVNNSVHSYYSKDRIEGRAKYWTFSDDYDILSGFVRNVTDPLAYLSEYGLYSSSEYVITYNEKGWVDKIYDDNKQVRYSFKYDENGHWIVRSTYDLPMDQNKWENNRLISTTHYTRNGAYDREDRFTWQNNNTYEYSGAGSYSTLYVFDNNDKLIKMSYSNIVKTYSYDSYGRVQKSVSTSTSNSGTGNTTRTYTYDKYNNIIKCNETYNFKYKNGPNTIYEECVYLWEYEFDNYGNWTRKTLYHIAKGDIEVKTKTYDITREIEYF